MVIGAVRDSSVEAPNNTKSKKGLAACARLNCSTISKGSKGRDDMEEERCCVRTALNDGQGT